MARTCTPLAPARIALALLASSLTPTLAAAPAAPAAGQATPDRERAQFAPCHGPNRVTCVVDGDTFWYRGEKIRIADINAPELSRPACPVEARLAAAATVRLTQLLNAGGFTLAAWQRRVDR